SQDHLAQTGGLHARLDRATARGLLVCPRVSLSRTRHGSHRLSDGTAGNARAPLAALLTLSSFGGGSSRWSREQDLGTRPVPPVHARWTRFGANVEASGLPAASIPRDLRRA